MAYKTNPATIILTAVVTAVVVGSGVFMWQSKTADTTPDRTSNKAADAPVAQVSCPQHWTMYQSQNISFCYKNSWGTPKLLDETHEGGKGKLFNIRFAKDAYVNNAHSTPDLWWETKDFAPAAADYSTTCFDCINFNKSESENIKALGTNDKNVTAKKVIVAGKNALRVHVNYFEPAFQQGQINRLDYYIPNAFGDYHFQASAGYSAAAELDMFMNYLSFKE